MKNNIIVNQYFSQEARTRSSHDRRPNRRDMPMTEAKFQIVMRGKEVFHMVGVDRSPEYRTEEEAWAALQEHVSNNLGVLEQGIEYAVIRVCRTLSIQ